MRARFSDSAQKVTLDGYFLDNIMFFMTSQKTFVCKNNAQDQLFCDGIFLIPNKSVRNHLTSDFLRWIWLLWTFLINPSLRIVPGVIYHDLLDQKSQNSISDWFSRISDPGSQGKSGWYLFCKKSIQWILNYLQPIFEVIWTSFTKMVTSYKRGSELSL